MKKITVSDAICSLRPNCQFILSNENYEDIIWHNENDLPPPTEEDIEAEIERLQLEYDYNQYQRDRAAAYPSIEDQLDLLYHDGIDAWREEINKVKEKYPKPEGL